MQSTIPLMSSTSTRLKADAGSAEAESTLQDHATWTSVGSDAFDVGKQDVLWVKTVPAVVSDCELSEQVAIGMHAVKVVMQTC